MIQEIPLILHLVHMGILPGQSIAGLAFGTIFSAIPRNAGTISPMIKRTPLKMIYTPPAKLNPFCNSPYNPMCLCFTFKESRNCWVTHSISQQLLQMLQQQRRLSLLNQLLLLYHVRKKFFVGNSHLL